MEATPAPSAELWMTFVIPFCFHRHSLISLDAADGVLYLCAAFADAPEELDATLFDIRGSSVSAVERGASELVAQVSAKRIANIGHQLNQKFLNRN